MQCHANRPHLLLICLIKKTISRKIRRTSIAAKRGGLRGRLARFSVSPGIVAASTIQLHFSFVELL